MRTLLTVPLVLWLAACGAAGAGKPTSPPRSPTPASTPTPTPTPQAHAPFFPFAVGDTWTYSDNPLSGCSRQVLTETDTIDSVSHGADGSLTAVDKLGGNAYSGNNPGPETFTVSPDGSVVGLLNGHALVRYPPAGVIQSGQTVSVDLGQQPGVLSVSAHGAGVVSVSVPAGRFTAQLLVIDTTNVGAAVFPGSGATPGPATTVTATMYWLVQGVGLVKQTDPTGSQHGVACTDVLQLTKYHINP